MPRHITRIENWDAVNWDEVDFENFDMASLHDASVMQLAEFSRHHGAQKRETKQGDHAVAVEAHFRKAVLNGRDPRSDRLFGEYGRSYSEFLRKYIPPHQIWDLTGIEQWSERDWQSWPWLFYRPFFIDRTHPNFLLIESVVNDRYDLVSVPERFNRVIENWNQVIWFFCDFENFDESSLDPDIVPDHYIQEYHYEADQYRAFWQPREESRRTWDGVSFDQWDWSGPAPDIHIYDKRNRERAKEAKTAWEQQQRTAEDDRRRVDAEQRAVVESLGQAGITLPDES
jgi:hypothetical protein